MPNITAVEYILGVLLVIIGALAYLLIRGGKKDEQAWERSIENEPKKNGKVIRLDDYEEALSVDLSKIEEHQSN